MLAGGMRPDEILRDFPYVEQADIDAASNMPPVTRHIARSLCAGEVSRRRESSATSLCLAETASSRSRTSFRPPCITARKYFSNATISWLYTRGTELFRRVELPVRVSGKLLLHSMPGRYEAIESVWQQVRNEAVRAIVCLAEKDEIREKSLEYARELEAGTVPCSVLPFEIPDRGAPEDRDGFWALAGNVAKRLQSGEVVLIHCAGGVGRTATLAVSVLLALGESVSEARNAVSRAGSTVETTPQSTLISWCASQVGIK